MQINNIGTQVNGLLEGTQKVMIVTRENPTWDGIFSILALNEYLIRLGKQTCLVSGEISNPDNISGVSGFVNSIPPRNLVISFDYVEGSIEKVSYNVEGDKFNLVVTPRGGLINPEKVNYSYSGEIYDVVFVIDVPELPLIAKGAVGVNETPNTTLINIDHTQINTLYGQINFVDVGRASSSEMVLELLNQLSGLNSDNATLLYQGIKAATQNFSLGVKSETLKNAAHCLKVVESAEIGPEGISGTRKDSQDTEAKDVAPESVEEPTKLETKPVESEKTPDSSWLSPKIFRNSQLEN
ncbi:MAG: hypothetical protein A3F33_03835 [Candidatus Woykebacteria bacterium RIFCSPHIGHO2_12_FULL_43_10]|uniref:DDH domain-containing protein n=2 Tax=Candidatus Woykeibacteriota TaxID=1817899 RepID=A0A1G1WV64_9BACT|nr:MAG: hypothetical protein A2802_02265 [Candidatus Woykebacteria bacterium RIFCSPHIGHO2_01_FULL_43_29]OGY29366.1 MAG: hypothetical protein A3F33_03835 [Candidatus Woykebacteria bacterium RIFCSPHIGHO2_12_FULL_43_10]OGY29436.1 MAG: hypothetical protein A3J50_00605 [Candidatus Woykebacteria bacterium RIFCSPHIGHO2_02_FULL_43_16b]OGY31659.1 MAG: hypothetical protein A3A61_03810 [Candidatus Woykebacteria bacterium RIFCSPLOWO2_01_FULL_43_14]